MNRIIHWRTGAAVVYTKEFLYYENLREGLGFEFEMQIDVAVDNIAANPTLWSLVSKNVRRIIVHRFPFLMYYKVHKGWIEIIGLRHAKLRQGKFVRRKAT